MKKIKFSKNYAPEEDSKITLVTEVLFENNKNEKIMPFNEKDFRMKISETIFELFGSFGIVQIEINGLCLEENQNVAKIVCKKSQLEKVGLLLGFVTEIKETKVRLRRKAII